MKTVRRVVVAALAIVGLVAILTALTLWLAARPVLSAASRDAQAVSPLCASEYRIPKGYPKGLREVQSLKASQYVVYRDTCHRHAIGGCYYLTSTPRRLGFDLYRPAYLNDCEVRALTLRQDSLLGNTLHRLHPDRDPATLNSAELDCVAAVLRYGWNQTAEERGGCTLPRPPAAGATHKTEPAS